MIDAFSSASGRVSRRRPSRGPPVRLRHDETGLEEGALDRFAPRSADARSTASRLPAPVARAPHDWRVRYLAQVERSRADFRASAVDGEPPKVKPNSGGFLFLSNNDVCDTPEQKADKTSTVGKS